MKSGLLKIRSLFQAQKVSKIFSEKIDYYEKEFLSAGFKSYWLFFAIGLLVFIFLFSTVHNRSVKEIKKISKPRYHQLIKFWIDKGFIKHGGVWLRTSKNRKQWSPPSKNEEIKYAYKGAMSYLYIAYFLEKMNHSIRGSYSYRLMCFHNQIFVLLSSALLGLLAMRLSLRFKIKPFQCLLLGVGCQIVYQTFPVNLWYYWELYNTTVSPIFAIIFLIVSEKIVTQEKAEKRYLVIRFISVFGLFYLDYPTAVFFIATYFVICAVLGHSLSNQFLFRSLILPACLGMGLIGLQLLWIKISYPEIEFVGGGFLFRTGLDGSIAKYIDHFNLLFDRRRDKLGFLNWKYLFWASSFTVLLLIALYHKISQLKYPVFVLLCALGLYVPFAFLFSQVTVIHPYMYDAYLVIPLILSFFAILPAVLEMKTKYTGVFSLLFFMMACCYAAVQIRAYATQFPL